MKKIIRLSVFIITLITLITSCKKIDEISNPIKISKNPYEKIGKLHNDFLTNVKNNFVPNMTITNLEDGFSFITDFHVSYVLGSSLNSEEKAGYVKSLNEYKRFVNTHEFYNEFFTSESKDSQGRYYDYLKEAYTIGIIDNFEFEQLNMIGQKLVENYYGEISNTEFEQLLIKINNKWIAKNYSTDSETGQILAMSLSLSFSSIEWWKENPDAFGDAKLPPVVGADIAGAVVGGVVAGVNSYILNGEVNWGAVGLGAGAGAITGSTGVVGKVGKWISSLF
jgi:hypothetical protein